MQEDTTEPTAQAEAERQEAATPPALLDVKDVARLLNCSPRTVYRLPYVTRDSMEKWMNRAEDDGMGARTRDTYRSAIMASCN